MEIKEGNVKGRENGCQKIIIIKMKEINEIEKKRRNRMRGRVGARKRGKG